MFDGLRETAIQVPWTAEEIKAELDDCLSDGSTSAFTEQDLRDAQNGTLAEALDHSNLQGRQAFKSKSIIRQKRHIDI